MIGPEVVCFDLHAPASKVAMGRLASTRDEQEMSGG